MRPMMPDKSTKMTILTFWRDERFLQIVGQVLFLLFFGATIYFLTNNMILGLQKQGMTLGFAFLKGLAGFDIGESLIEYSRESPYSRAFLVGLLNTLLVSVLGIAFSTILGIVVGVARLSTNFLVNRIAWIFIEIMRNIPLLVLLVFWYSGVFLNLPRVKDSIILPGQIFLSNRGVAIPWGLPGETWTTYLVILAAGVGLATVTGILLTTRGRRTGRMPFVTGWSLLVFLFTAIIGWLILPQSPLTPDLPYVRGLNLAGGKILSPEFMALLSGLVIYTAAFIGEVVRAGIQSVPKGQVEAGRALGLSSLQAMRLVIFPQALRVIVPPLTSQYLNLAKNSSLAVAIAYPDLFYVSNTISNQTGRAVEMISIVMAFYLGFSLLTSLFMNWYNRYIQLVER
jgi:general L-amino acid transport system permease protein